MIDLIPDEFADLIIIDPPYNLTKNFNGLHFNSRTETKYDDYLASWFPKVCKKLKSNGSLYMCGDWKCTSSLQRAIEKELTILNRITWQREKGRGAKTNWKNGISGMDGKNLGILSGTLDRADCCRAGGPDFVAFSLACAPGKTRSAGWGLGGENAVGIRA